MSPTTSYAPCGMKFRIPRKPRPCGAGLCPAPRGGPVTFDRHAEHPRWEAAPEGTRWIRCYKLQTGPSQLPGWRWEPIDMGVADLVEQLQRCSPEGGLPLLTTAGCCAGHRPGQLPHVILPDGRVISLLPDMAHHARVETGQWWHRAWLWIERIVRRLLTSLGSSYGN